MISILLWVELNLLVTRQKKVMTKRVLKMWDIPFKKDQTPFFEFCLLLSTSNNEIESNVVDGPLLSPPPLYSTDDYKIDGT